MRILLVTDPYPPEICSAAALMKELAVSLSARSHEVAVLTTSPRYKLDQDAIKKVWSEYSIEDSAISVIRAPTFPLRHVGYIRRGIASILAPFQMWRTLRRHVKRDFDVVFIYSPPITLGLIGLIAKRRGMGVLLNVQDIFPQNAIDLGILRNPMLIAFFRWIEHLSYKYADIVTAHSKGNLNVLSSSYPNLTSKFRVLHNWIDVSCFSASRMKNYRSLFGLEGKFIALFAGVIGPAQGTHILVEVADRLRDLDNFVLLMVGDGAERRRVEELSYSRGLKNIIFKPFISQSDYPDLLASCDVGLICLSSDSKTPVVPGKMLGYMGASLPIAAFVNAESDIHEIVADAQCGSSCISSDVAEMEKILRRLHGNPDLCRDMGRNGRSYVAAHFSTDRIVTEIECILEEIQRYT